MTRIILNILLALVLASCLGIEEGGTLLSDDGDLFAHSEEDSNVLIDEVDHNSESDNLELTDHEYIASLYDDEISDEQVYIKAVVKKVLSDDNDGSRHQRFILELDNHQTVLVAHNIDLAPRVENIETGAEIFVYGEYEWNNKGGVIHWTHHDPDGDHIGGFIKYLNNIYE